MSDLLGLLTSQLGGAGGGLLKQLGRQADADDASAEKGIASALPMLIGGLTRNVNQSPEAAEKLNQALDRDHDGSFLEQVGGALGSNPSAALGALGGLMGGQSSGFGGLLDMAGPLLSGMSSPKAGDGDGILGHILGAQRGKVEQSISKSTGMGLPQVGDLLKMLAPLVMSALGKIKRERGLDANGLKGFLNQESSSLESQAPNLKSGGLMGMLDLDGDGDPTDDMMQLGGSLLGKLF